MEISRNVRIDCLGGGGGGDPCESALIFNYISIEFAWKLTELG